MADNKFIVPGLDSLTYYRLAAEANLLTNEAFIISTNLEYAANMLATDARLACKLSELSSEIDREFIEPWNKVAAVLREAARVAK